MPRGRLPNTLEMFWSYVAAPNAQGCRLWLGPIHHSGYGAFNCNKRPYQAHRVAYYLTHPGEISLAAPSDKLVKEFVLHKCDVRACCEAQHLFLGSTADNMEDMVKKGRQRGAKGENNPASKLSHVQVEQIRKILVSRNLTQWEIAREFGVSQSAVSLIKLRKAYAEVPCQGLTSNFAGRHTKRRTYTKTANDL